MLTFCWLVCPSTSTALVNLSNGGVTLSRILVPPGSKVALLPPKTRVSVTIVMTSPRSSMLNWAEPARPWLASEAVIAVLDLLELVDLALHPVALGLGGGALLCRFLRGRLGRHLLIEDRRRGRARHQLRSHVVLRRANHRRRTR